jgi:hypothetical protein
LNEECRIGDWGLGIMDWAKCRLQIAEKIDNG